MWSIFGTHLCYRIKQVLGCQQLPNNYPLRQWRRSAAFIFYFNQILRTFLVFPLLTLNK